MHPHPIPSLGFDPMTEPAEFCLGLVLRSVKHHDDTICVEKEIPMLGDTHRQWLRRHGLAVFLAAVAIVLFFLFAGYLTD